MSAADHNTSGHDGHDGDLSGAEVLDTPEPAISGSTNGGPESGDNDVGYGRPPKTHQFKPGHSGNPKGRPKGAKGLKTVFSEALSERVRVTKDGRTRNMSKGEVIIQQLVNKAAGGDPKSTMNVLNLSLKVLGSGEEEGAAGDEVLSADDQAIMQAFLEDNGLAPPDTPAVNGKPAAARRRKSGPGGKTASAGRATSRKKTATGKPAAKKRAIKKTGEDQ